MSETEAGAVVVIDQTGRHHHFDADDWLVTENGYVHVLKDGSHAKPVATFPPGYIGVYNPSARAAVSAVRVPAGAGECAAS